MTSSVPEWLFHLHTLERTPENLTVVSHKLQHVGKHIYATTRHSKDWFVLLTELCIYVGDAHLTTQILTHFARSVLDMSTASWFETLRDAFGIGWFRNLWSQCGKWCGTFDLTPDLVTKLDVDILRTVLDTYEMIDMTFETVHTMLKACIKVRGVPVVPEKWICALETWRETPFPVQEMTQFLVLYSHVDGLDAVKRYVLRVLDDELETFDNPGWSLIVVKTPPVCQCDACSSVVRFLESKDQVKLECQMPVRQRNHVTVRWRKLCDQLPLEWRVKKNVRPYACVIVKKWWLSHEWPRRQRYRECIESRDALINLYPLSPSPLPLP